MAKKTKPTMWEEGKTIIMPKTLHKKWTKALRSGEYEQARGSLYDSFQGGFCCLGVLCHVAGVDAMSMDMDSTPSTEFLMDNGVRFRNKHQQTGASAFNDMVDDPTLVIKRGASAAGCNDSGKYDFNKIADLIDEVVQVY